SHGSATERGNKVERNTARILNSAITNIFIIVLGIGMLYPVAWLITASFKEGNTIFNDPSLWPKSFTLDNYVKGWQGIGIVSFGRFFLNSFIICFLSVI